MSDAPESETRFTLRPRLFTEVINDRPGWAQIAETLEEDVRQLGGSTPGSEDSTRGFT